MNFLINTFMILLYVYGALGWFPVALLYDQKFRFKKVLIVFIMITWILSASYVIQSFKNLPSIEQSVIGTEGKYKSHGMWYNTKEEYCRSECRYMLKDLADTWGNNTNNQDSISKTVMECYYDCVK